MSDDRHMTFPEDGDLSTRSRSALDWVARTVGNDALLRELEARARRRRRRRAIVGGAVAAVVLGFVSLRQLPQRRDAIAAAEPVQITTPQQMILPDGSLAELRDGARLAVDFSGPLRRVTLLAGQAHFAVQKNPARPFVVHAAGVDVRAVGTAFAVDVAAHGVEVLVTEGKVAVDRAPADEAAPAQHEPLAFVAAGEGTRVDSTDVTGDLPSRPRVTPIAPAEIAERLSWRVPRLELSGTPLAVAVEALNRHSHVKLVIGDPALAKLQVSGIVRADQADALVNLLAANFDVTAESRGGETVLRRRVR